MTGISPTRRRLCKTVLATIGAVSVAGCLGDAFDDPDPTDGSDGVTDPEEWADVDEIRLLGYARYWEGVEPAECIEGVENPTLVLTAGSTYEITWENAENMRHNLEIWDENDEIVDDYSTTGAQSEGETETLEIEASQKMESYVCYYHDGHQLGDIDIVAE